MSGGGKGGGSKGKATREARSSTADALRCIEQIFYILVAVALAAALISAEAKGVVGTATFSDLMLEMGILTGVVVALGLTIFMLRHTEGTEPRPYDPDVDESDIARQRRLIADLICRQTERAQRQITSRSFTSRRVGVVGSFI
jgi:hypothetical protein